MSQAVRASAPMLGEETRAIAVRPWYRIPTLVIGLGLAVAIAGLALLAPVLTPYNPTMQNLNQILLPPSSAHLLGTDQLGKDVWAELLYGARVDLQIAFIAMLLPLVLGTTLGLLSGYFGGVVDAVVMRAVEVIVAFPVYVLIIAFVFVLGPGAASIYVAITLVSWVSYARISRGEMLVAKTQEYVLAARSAGLSNVRIIGRHILPNTVTQSIVFATSDVVLNLLMIVTLGYLGLGIPPPSPDWGRMIYEGQSFLTTNWQLSTIPGVAVVIVGLALSLIGDGLADLLRRE
jgi:peptide/nickel transport system permease protein